MKLEFHRPHRWDVAPYEAKHLQEDLVRHVIVDDDYGNIRTLAGIEVGHSRFDDRIHVAVALLSYPDLELIAKCVIEHRTRFPFVPDLLSFREVPAILQALEDLPVAPDLLIVDGPGIAHPKAFGVASHLGVVLDLPSIGCSKVNLVGSFVEPEVIIGSSTNLVWQGEIIGTVYRSKNRVAPLFISAGHRIGRQTAARFVKECCQGYRLPEPIRIASSLLSGARQTAKALGALD